MINGLTKGRIVHYVPCRGTVLGGKHLAAVVVKVWNRQEEHACVNLVVFKDGSNDTVPGVEPMQLSFWATSVLLSADQTKEHTFHFPQDCSCGD
jgi:hypothetical protein